MTLGQLGRLCEKAPSTLCEVESGRIDLPSSQVPRVARSLGAEIWDLFEGVR
jgi:hypothetical protein